MMCRKLSALVFFLLPALLTLGQSQQQTQFSGLSVSDGLSHNQVNSILKDHTGFMWFGTMSGLNRYDGHQFKIFRHIAADSNSVSDDFIANIFELPDNKLYIVTRNGVNIYTPENETFSTNIKTYLSSLNIKAKLIKEVLKDNAGNFWFNAADQGIYKYSSSVHITTHLASKGVSAIQKDNNGNIWIIHQDKTIDRIDKNGLRIVEHYAAFKTRELNDYRLFIDNDGDLWTYTYNGQHGIDYYSPSTGKRKYIDKGPLSLNSNLINGMIQDASGMIWIGTDHGGINLLNKADFSIRYLLNKEDDPKTLIQNSIVSLYRDPTGIIWIGTFKKGISYYHKDIIKFPVYNHQASSPNGLLYEDVNRFVEDAAGNLWIGTNGGGLFYFNRKSGEFKNYVHESSNSNSLSNNVIVSLFIDHEQKLWIGSYFGGLDCFDGHNFKNYRHQNNKPESLADDRVWDILEDRDHKLWVATLGGGLDLFNRDTETFKHYIAYKANSIGSNYVSRLIEDHNGNLWIGTSSGLDKLQKNTQQFIHYKNEPGNPQSLSNDNIYDLLEDSYGYIWAATREGLSRFDPRSGRFANFGTAQGLTEKATMRILEEDKHNLWVSTANGLFHVRVTAQPSKGLIYTFRNYDKQDGLQDDAFNAGAAYKLRTGELIFGGANGFNLFQPQNIKSDTSVPVLVFSDLQVANKSVAIGEKIEGNVLLSQSLTSTKSLTFNHHLNVFSIEFSALNFFNPDKIRYQYKLEGFDKHWQEPQAGTRRATYTNLDPGDYVFKIRSTNAAGNWVDNEKDLQIAILPPFWQTRWAYLAYFLLVGGSLLSIRHRGIRKIRKEFALEQERQQARRMHELDMLKIKFFTNVSHEFRTPLSLIISPLDKLIRQAKEQEKQQLQMIQRNGRRLLNLVNQLLDFRRMEVQELQLHRKPGDIVQFIRELSLSFTDEAEKKHISFTFCTNNNSLVTLFDYDKIERIMFNLLSNAFKFTPEGGVVEVKLEHGLDAQQKSILILKVCDTGIGIAPGMEDKIFERFFQSDLPDTIVNQGSGIGLSITKEFVKLHQGQITVQSGDTTGSVFTVTLPLPEVQMQFTTEPDVLQLNTSLDNTALQDTNTDSSYDLKKPVLLLVEDNDDFRFYLKDNLKEHYNIVEAADGKAGWQKVLSAHPNLVVSDVSMPIMNGIDLCKKIKADKRTAAVPVILLTALTAEEKQLEGLETGASDYMTKPFNFEILLSKIRNLLSQQQISKHTYQKQLDVNPAEVEIESVDEKFIRLASTHMEKHLSDAGYSVDQLSADLNISRVGLYKKLMLLTGKSPVEFMRSYRLKKAVPLLKRSQLTIAEIAYEVGFNNPKQFSKYFKQEFDVLPSSYIAQITAKKDI